MSSDIAPNKILGKGNFGTVFEGVWKGIQVAIKRVSLDRTTSSEREENALTKFDHANVIKLFHVEEDQDFKYLINSSSNQFICYSFTYFVKIFFPSVVQSHDDPVVFEGRTHRQIHWSNASTGGCSFSISNRTGIYP